MPSLSVTQMFEKIPMSIERQRHQIEMQINDITRGVQDLKATNGECYSIKQLEKMKKSLNKRLEKLNDSSRKDDVVYFEELGVDRIFVDESHNYKNLFLYTKNAKCCWTVTNRSSKIK